MKDAQFAKFVVFVNALVPLALLAWDVAHDRVGANKVEFVLHTTGMLALIFLTLSLAVTPLRKLSGVNFLSHFRRMLGLFAFFYGVLHLLTYSVADKSLNFVAIVEDTIAHPYIALGMASLGMMIPLAITSTNASVKRMGAAAWKRLHKLAYVAALAAVLHYWFLVKADTRLPMAFAIAVVLLLAYRGLDAIRPRARSPVPAARAAS
jgi:methionine sulfoxide reductase heme-binding subunit